MSAFRRFKEAQMVNRKKQARWKWMSERTDSHPFCHVGCYSGWNSYFSHPFCHVGCYAGSCYERGLGLLEFATFNELVLTNILGHHKASRRWTWHSPNGKHHSQIDYILMRKRFQSGVNIARTRRFPRADIGSDHDLLMMTFHLRLKRISKPKHTRLKFDLEKLKDPNVLETFQATIGGKFAPLTWRGRPGFNDQHLQHSSDWNSQ